MFYSFTTAPVVTLLAAVVCLPAAYSFSRLKFPGRRFLFVSLLAANAFPKFVWINPEPQGVWSYRQSIAVVQQLMNQRMFPLTLQGLEGAMRLLSK